VVVEDVVVLGGQAPVAGGGGVLVGVPEEDELQLGAAHDRVAERGGLLQLSAQDRAGRHLDGLAGLLVEQVAHDQGRRLQPGDAAQGGQVGPAAEVAVALLPGGVLVAREDVHVDIDRQQVVAGLDRTVDHMVEEVVPRHPFAHEPSLKVGEDDEYGVDVARADLLFESAAFQR
jgi:hypothetical protein